MYIPVPQLFRLLQSTDHEYRTNRFEFDFVQLLQKSLAQNEVLPVLQY